MPLVPLNVFAERLEPYARYRIVSSLEAEERRSADVRGSGP
jgi:hypothetical protein